MMKFRFVKELNFNNIILSMKTTLEHILVSTYKEGSISYMNAHPEAFEEAITLTVSGTGSCAWRAAGLVWSCMEKNDKRVQKHIKKIIDTLKTADDSRGRELIHILLKMEITEKYEGHLFDLCITIWEDVYRQPSVRINAFKILINIVKKHPDLANEITYLIQSQYMETLSPGVKHSVSKLLKGLNL
jgi:hypothetical protein